MTEREHAWPRLLNRAALGLGLFVLLALAAVWAWDQLRPLPPLRWGETRFVSVRAPEPLAAGRERWVVAMNPACAHCRRHFEWLAARVAGRASPPALGVLVVDAPRRPDTLALIGATPAGVWWDSAGAWRTDWGRRLYGETYRFDTSGRLLGLTRADQVPDSARGGPAPAPVIEGR